MADNESAPVAAVVWDFDGTLVDTRERNLNVTRRIMSALYAAAIEELQVLRSVSDYEAATHRTSHWLELYTQELGLTRDQAERAGEVWGAYQLEDATPAPVFEGVRHVVETLRHLPQAIVSLNSRGRIAASMDEHGLLPHFEVIIGHEDIDPDRQKPEPDGLLRCLELLGETTGGDIAGDRILYVGDHHNDMECVGRANQTLEHRGEGTRVVSVAALYGSSLGEPSWSTPPDFRARRPHDILSILALL